MQWKPIPGMLMAHVTTLSLISSGVRRAASSLVALAFSAIYALAGESIIALLTSLPALQNMAGHYLIWQVILPVVGVWCYLLDGMFVGATRGAEMRNSMAVAACGFALTLLTVPTLGNHGLWLSLVVFLALRGLTLAWVWRRHWRNGTGFPVLVPPDSPSFPPSIAGSHLFLSSR